MLKIAGELADATTMWMVGPKTLGDHIVPTINGAAERRPAARVAVGLPMCVAADAGMARIRAAKLVLDVRDAAVLPGDARPRTSRRPPADVAIVGDERSVASQIIRLSDLGGTDLMAAVFRSSEERERSMELLAHLARGR